LTKWKAAEKGSAREKRGRGEKTVQQENEEELKDWKRNPGCGTNKKIDTACH